MEPKVARTDPVALVLRLRATIAGSSKRTGYLEAHGGSDRGDNDGASSASHGNSDSNYSESSSSRTPRITTPSQDCNSGARHLAAWEAATLIIHEELVRRVFEILLGATSATSMYIYLHLK